MNDRRAATLPLVLLAISLCSGCAAGGGGLAPSRFQREFQRYLSLPHQKAFAVAGDREDNYVFGYSYGWRGPELARDDALEQCNIRRRSLGEEAECRIYAVGNEILWQRAGDAEPGSPPP